VLGNLPVSDPLHREIVARFWQQPDLLLCVVCGLGVAAIERRLPRCALAVAGASAVLPLALRWGSMDRHRSTLVRAYGAEILRAAPPGALLLTRGDLVTNSTRYLQAVEGLRPDVRVVDEELLGDAWYAREVAGLHPELALPGARYMPGAPDGFDARQLFDATFGRAPLLACGVKEGDVSADATYGRWPFGFCAIVHRGDEPVSIDAWLRDSEEALPRIDFAGQGHPPGSWEDAVWSDTWEARQARAVQLLAVAGADPARHGYVVAAADILQALADENPDLPAHILKNLAIALGRAGLETPAQRARAAAAWKRYLAVAPKDDPQLPAIERELARLQGAP
jgi:hypothetical protein